MEIVYRKGKKQDCTQLAEMIDIASGGILYYLFHDIVPGKTPVEMVTRNLQKGIYPYSYQSVVVAEHEGRPIGMALSYPSDYHGITEKMTQFFPADRLTHLRGFFSARVERSWYLDSLCVLPGFEGRGIATQLIERTGKRALENGYESISLIAFADNTRGMRLYRHIGFETIERIDLAPNDFIRYAGGGLLLYFEIPSQTSPEPVPS
jgi:ribosomal protein S18 acetylase RimI-like enzyme